MRKVVSKEVTAGERFYFFLDSETITMFKCIDILSTSTKTLAHNLNISLWTVVFNVLACEQPQRTFQCLEVHICTGRLKIL